MANRTLTQPQTSTPPEREQEPTVTATSVAAASLGWLTLERAAYLLLVIVGLGLRLAQLGYRPLAPDEAREAWNAWQTVQNAPPVAPSASPLLFSLNVWSFTIVGAMDTVARFWPALLGALLPVWAYLLRGRLGQTGALVSAVLLTFSTHLLYFSRTVGGDAMAASLTLALLAALIRFHDGNDERWLLAAAVFAGLLLTSAASAYFGVLGVIALVGFGGRDGWRKMVATVRGEIARKAALLFGLTYLLSSTAFFRAWTRLGDGPSLLGQWLGGFFGGDSPYPLTWFPARLVVDEPLFAAVAVAAVALLVRLAIRRQAWTLETGLAAWGVGALLLVTVRSGRQAGDLVMVVLPLALLAGPLLVRLVRGIPWQTGREEAAIFLIGGVVLLVLASVLVTRYTFGGDTANLQLAIVPLGIVVAFVLFYSYWVHWRFALHMAALLGLIAVAAMNLSAAWTSSLDLDPARRPALTLTAADDGLRALVREAEQISVMRVGDTYAMPIAVTGPTANPMLAWAFRRFTGLSLVSSVSAETAPPVVISPRASPPALAESYSGSAFTVTRTFDPFRLPARDLLRWLQYRRAVPDAETREQVILWLRPEED